MFKHHPDGLLTIGGLVVPLSWFISQEPEYSLPTGMIGREYAPGRHFVFDGVSQHDGGEWSVGDAYLAKEPAYRDAWEAAARLDQAAVKLSKWSDIRAERDRRKAGGFKVKVGGIDKWFHSDADSRIQHLGLKDKARDLLAAGGAMTDKITILGQAVKWKTMDGSFVEVTAQVALDIVAAAADLDAQLFAAAETHRATVEAALDPDSYNPATGWPATFGG